MEPTLRAGDVLLIDAYDAKGVPRDSIYVLRIDDSVLVKRLQKLPGGRIQVSSDNPAYQSFTLEPKDEARSVAIIGRVIWVGKRV